MTAVKRNGLVLEAVPGELRTPQICRAALKAVDSADYKILPYIPYPDICLEGLKKFGMSFVDKFEIFASIAPEVMTGELALHGVGMDASCLSLVPVELRTEAVCLRARQPGTASCSMKCRRNYARNGSARPPCPRTTWRWSTFRSI